MSFWTDIPSLSRADLRDLKKGIDASFREFSRNYGEGIEAFFDPLYFFLVKLEKLLIAAPWPIILIIVGGLAYLGSRSWKLALGSMLSFVIIGYFGMWKDMMATISLISVATFICIAIGIPVGILMSRYDRVQSLITPVLDLMQTIPIFVYLLPVVMLLGIGRVPGLIAVCVYALPPIIRLTNLGIRLVDKEILEAADAFGSNYRQKRFSN